MVLSRYIGARVKRREDPRLITGRATYTDDIRLPDTLYLAVLRSPHAHARIRRIDASRAQGAPGVVAVVTGEEVRRNTGPIPVYGSVDDSDFFRVPEKYALAVDKVRHGGEGGAAVVATRRYGARDALELVDVEYEPLPAVVDVERAARDASVRVYEELPDNLCYYVKKSKGDVEGAFAEADGVVRLRMVQPRLIPMALEPRAALAWYQPGPGTLTVWVTSQNPHVERNELARILKLPAHLVRAIAPEVGGGFGSKIDVYPEEVLCAYLSMKLGRPVKWTGERQEEFVATIHGRGQVQEVEAAYRRDGTITGVRLRLWADLGAHCQLFTHAIPTLTPTMACGPYRFTNVAWELWGVYTNKTPTDAYRGAGRPEAAYLLERTVDQVAYALGMDPLEVRRRNFIPPEAFPYETPTGATYDTADYDKALRRALELAEYDKLRREQAEARRQGRLLGIGLSTYTEICGFGPSKDMPDTGGWDAAIVRADRTGKVTVYTSASPHGQGEETAFAQIVAERLGIPLEDVTVLHGDTATLEGTVGTQGSRTLAVAGSAVFQATERVVAKAKQVAAVLLRVPEERVHFSGGVFTAEDIPDRRATFAEVAREAYAAKKIGGQVEPGLEATAYFEPPKFTFPFGADVCVVEVEPQTGEVRILKYVAVNDCGTIVNPMLVDGQLHGGLAQGIAQAVSEEAVYDESGQLLTGSLMDYAVPYAHDLPFFEVGHTTTPTPVNPLGAKGVGECGTISATPAVVNAVVDALSHLGVRHIEMPLKPERVWRILREKGVAR